MKIKNLAKVDGPREKSDKYGTDKLTNPEFLAVLPRKEKGFIGSVRLAVKG
jgi:DNA repair protein RadC